jgi:hypothetical protein
MQQPTVVYHVKLVYTGPNSASQVTHNWLYKQVVSPVKRDIVTMAILEPVFLAVKKKSSGE